MLIARKITLRTPLLASRRPAAPGDRREFKRLPSSDGSIAIHANMERWRWAFLEARDALGLDVNASAIIPAYSFRVKRTTTYTRNFRRGSRLCSERYEALPTGQVLVWEFTVSQHTPPGVESMRHSKPPTLDEFDAMLSHIGEYLGMSEWGHEYLYGRFSAAPIDS